MFIDDTTSAEPSAANSWSTNTSPVAAEVSRRLMATGRFSSGQVRVSASGDTIQLWGRVGSYYHKQLAQVAALQVSGVHHLRNEVEVVL